MPAKAPIYLKPGSGKKGKKCRLRDILSPDMISPPLGDFRHTVHIGRGGQRDAFGDMSFLQGRFELLPGKAAAGLAPHFSSPIGAQSDGQRTGSTSDAYFAETPSPVLKNAISLPAIGGGQALTLPAISSAGAFPHPPPPGEDLPGPAAAAVAVDRERAGRLEDARLRSVQVFADEPAQQAPPGPTQSKPDVLLDLLGKPSEPAAKSVSGATRQKRGDRRAGKPRHFSHAGSISSSYKTNGSLHSDASSDSYESFDGKGSFLCGSHEEEEIYGGDGTGTCHFGLFGHTVALGYEKGLSRFSADYADGDSGVEEGRVCDLDYGFSKEKSVSRDSLVQITGSLLSLELDLGPSILDEVLNIMDKPPAKSRP